MTIPELKKIGTFYVQDTIGGPERHGYKDHKDRPFTVNHEFQFKIRGSALFISGHYFGEEEHKVISPITEILYSLCDPEATWLELVLEDKSKLTIRNPTLRYEKLV